MWGTRKGKNMDIKSLLETEIEEKHIQNFIYYSMIFIVLFVINFYVYFTYFNGTFFEINILKSIVLVISFSFPVYFLNCYLHFKTSQYFIKTFQEEKWERDNILRKINHYNIAIDRLENLVDNYEDIINKHKITPADDLYVKYKEAENKLFHLKDKALSFQLDHINAEELVNNYKNRINNKFKKTIITGSFGYFFSMVLALYYLPKTFNGFLSRFIFFNSILFLGTLLSTLYLSIYDKYKVKFKESKKVKMIFIILFFVFASPIMYFAINEQVIHNYILSFINSLI